MKYNNNNFIFFFYIYKKIFLYLLLSLIIIIFYIFKTENNNNSKKDFLNKNESMKIKLSLVIPIKSRDFEKISRNFKFFKKFIEGITNLVFIGDKKVGKLIKNKQNYFKIPLKFINENALININKVKKLIKKRNKYAIRRSGWYIQQFLKMQYCKICQDEYYLIWDGDTIPVREVKMFNNNKPYFDVKTEYHKPYFITMKKVFPELGKKYKYSFISEHMLIKTEMMKDLINCNRIDINYNISGNTWYEKIINSINIKNLPYSGFSEYETYGTFVNKFYRKSYGIRHWKSLKPANRYYNPRNLTNNNLLNIAKRYNAVTFEK